MAHTYWRKQQPTQPLFGDILWARPQNKAGAGKLAVIGGNAHGFGAPGIAYNTALSSGVGICRVLLPDAIKKVVSGILPDADYAPSTPSGSFAKSALSDFVSLSNWGDLAILAGSVGRNSETAITVESFVQTYRGLLTVTEDAVDYFKEMPLQIVDRPQTLVVLSLSQLQRLFISTPSIVPVTLSMSSPQLADALHGYTQEHVACLIVQHNGLLFAAHEGQVVTHAHTEKIWRVATAARASVFWLQSPQQQFEAVVSSFLTNEEASGVR